eukprot:SAG31_NODE_2644_length_5315_cov_7.392063_2_plen_105_part_00
MCQNSDSVHSLFQWNEADYYEPNWQRSFFGTNYPQLLAVKAAYDPDGMFTCHHWCAYGVLVKTVTIDHRSNYLFVCTKLSTAVRTYLSRYSRTKFSINLEYFYN